MQPEIGAKLVQDVVRGCRGVALVNTFVDEPYHRTGFTLASPDVDKVWPPNHGAYIHPLHFIVLVGQTGPKTVHILPNLHTTSET
jgi:hypothetical protein